MKHEKLSVNTAWAVFISALLMVPALSAEVYRWTDENGVTHFSQTPPSGQEAEIADVPDTPVEDTGEGAGIDFDSGQAVLANDQENNGMSPADRRRQEIAERHEQRRAAQAAQQAECQEARGRLAKIEPNRRVYYTNEEGETERMDDEERVAEVEELHAFLSRNCP